MLFIKNELLILILFLLVSEYFQATKILLNFISKYWKLYLFNIFGNIKKLKTEVQMRKIFKLIENV